MITVTPAACACLAELLAEGPVSPPLVLRVVADEQGKLDVYLESPQPDDQVFSYRGRNVLALEPQAAQRLEGRTLDVQPRSKVSPTATQ